MGLGMIGKRNVVAKGFKGASITKEGYVYALMPHEDYYVLSVSKGDLWALIDKFTDLQTGMDCYLFAVRHNTGDMFLS